MRKVRACMDAESMAGSDLSELQDEKVEEKMTHEIKHINTQRELQNLWFMISLTFASLLFLLVFQFVLHISQTKDLQRRIGTLEQQVQELRQ